MAPARSSQLRGGSFTEAVVSELAPHVPLLDHCQAALLQGMALAAAADPAVPPEIVMSTARSAAARLALAVMHAQGRAASLVRQRTARRHRWGIAAPDGLPPLPDGERSCCDRALVRGAFLAAGSLSRPDGPAHLEIATAGEAGASALCAALERLGVTSSARRRRGRAVVLVRSVDGVAAALSGIGAQGGRLRFEEGRVVREVRGGVNRRINGETANLRRTVDAGMRQVGAAEGLQHDPERWRALPAAVREAAALRLRHPDDPLSQLAGRAGISRAAMAGRLRRLEVSAASPARNAVVDFGAVRPHAPQGQTG